MQKQKLTEVMLHGAEAAIYMPITSASGFDVFQTTVRRCYLNTQGWLVYVRAKSNTSDSSASISDAILRGRSTCGSDDPGVHAAECCLSSQLLAGGIKTPASSICPVRSKRGCRIYFPQKEWISICQPWESNWNLSSFLYIYIHL